MFARDESEGDGSLEVGGAQIGEAEVDTSRVSGWGRVFRGNRTLWLVALAAIVSLVAGLLLGRFVISPDAFSEETAEPGLVTVPVEFGPLSNDVTLRAEAGYADAVEVTVDTAAISGPAVVTGQVPEVGATLNPLSVALEVVGRPLVVLPGALPTYRTLRFGVSGPDVLQLKQALAGLGIDVGDVNSDLFDQATAAAVGAMYTQVGYPAPTPEDGAAEAVRGAEESLQAAQSGVAQAEHALQAAGAGPNQVEIFNADVKLAQAKQVLATARAENEGVQQAEWDLQSAQLERNALSSAADIGAEQLALDAARAELAAATKALDLARHDVLPYLPASEVLYLTELPRRVDAVSAKRGTTLTEAAMTVSGATVQLLATAAEADAKLLKPGGEATFELPGGAEHRAVVVATQAQKDNAARWDVFLEPDPLTPEQLTQVKDTNVKVRISVAATEADVLSVPLAALTVGPDGESRIEISDSDPREGKEAKTHFVVVKTGLAAKGAVEVTPVEGDLAQGDLVVVGR